MQDFLSSLNDSQRDAVIHTDGPMMIIAGAGSGKTRVITYRIAHLLNLGVDSFNILALTFTNKAAREMKERITHLVGGNEARNLYMGTFHSVFARILRAEADKLGYPSDFTIYDTDDSKNLLKAIIKESELDDKVYKPNVVYSRISSAKNNLITWQAYQMNNDIVSDDHRSRMPYIGAIYEKYVKRCFAASAMDFDDLLLNMNVLLRDFPEVLHKLQLRFRYIMVDEYQDTNYSQYLIVKKLASAHENICVVGDDAQSIYAFRGADIKNIHNFQKDYPALKVYKLEQNYRSTKNIVNAANSIIEKNSKQLPKTIWTANDEGEKISLIRAYSDNEEGQLVAHSIFENRANHSLPNKSFAILYRTNAQSRAMEEALRKLGIPYRIFGGMSFYQRKEVKDMIAYYRLTINHNDEEALKRIINYPARGIGQTTIDKLVATAGEKNVALWKVVENPREFGLVLNGGAMAKLDGFSSMIKSFRAIANTQSAFDAGNHIAIHSGLLKELYNDKSPEGVTRYEHLQELLNGLKEFSEADEVAEDADVSINSRFLRDYLQDIALLTGDENANDEDSDRVSMMTIHAAKGLEFPFVYIVGVEENLFPGQQSVNSREDLEEERRLFYVALTRAEKRAYVSYATSRYRWGTLISCEPSRFIDEIDSRYIDQKPQKSTRQESMFDDGWGSRSGGFSGNNRQVKEPFTNRKQAPSPPSSPAPAANKGKLKTLAGAMASAGAPVGGDDTRNLQAGMMVEHQRFGKGKVLSIDGAYPNQKAEVDFETAGVKNLILKFAKLTVIG
jgi:DNA helicase II / ATP-dependent DNA helicase PcrA